MATGVERLELSDVYSGYALVTHHIRAISIGIRSFHPSQKRAAAAILRRVANVFDEAEPEPQPLATPPHQELVRLSVPPQYHSIQDRRAGAFHTDSSYQDDAPCAIEQESKHAKSASKRLHPLSTVDGDLLLYKDTKRQKRAHHSGISSGITVVDGTPDVQLVQTTGLPRRVGQSPTGSSKSDSETNLDSTSAKDDDGSLFIPEGSELTSRADSNDCVTALAPCNAPSACLTSKESSTAPYIASADVGVLGKENISGVGTINREAESSLSAPKTRRSNRPVLLEITYSLSSEINQTTITQLRDKFFGQLCSKQINVQVSQRTQACGFSVEEATDITNLLFTDFVGWPALDRLRKLLAEHHHKVPGRIPVQGVVRAEHVCKQATTPQLLKKYFASISRSTRLSINGDASKNTAVQSNGVQGIISSIESYHLYGEVLLAAEQRNVEVITFLEQAGYKTQRPGQTWKSAAKKYICDTLGISPAGLSLQLQQSETAAYMVELFGPGIIPIFPIHALWKLRKWGLQRIRVALSIFKDVFPHLDKVSEALERYVYLPIVEGLPLPQYLIKPIPEVPIAEQIWNAVSRSEKSQLNKPPP